MGWPVLLTNRYQGFCMRKDNVFLAACATALAMVLSASQPALAQGVADSLIRADRQAEQKAAPATPAAVTQQPAIKSMKVAESLLQDIVRVGDRLVAVGERGHIIWSDDSGRSWNQAEVPTRQMLNAVFFINDSKGWAVGHDGLVLVTRDGGKTWELQLDGLKFVRQQAADQLPALQADVDKLKADLAAAERMCEVAEEQGKEDLSAQDAVGSIQDQIDSKEEALSDAEAALKETAAPPLMDVWFADENNGFAVGAFGQFLKTTDGGVLWQSATALLDNAEKGHLNAITGQGKVIFIAAEAGRIYRSQDGGNTWTLLPSPDPENGSFFAVGFLGGDQQVLLLGLRGAMYRSKDQGETWKKVDEKLHKNMNTAFMAANGVVLAVGNDGAFLRSRDNALTFQDHIQTDRMTLTSAVEAPDGNYVLVGSGGVKIIVPASL